MADETSYGAVAGELNKRKYVDSQYPVARRTTGFSSPPESTRQASSYNSVPPPMSDFELAKQKAQEIAARILNSADPSKRAKVENSAGVGGGFDAIDAGNNQKHNGLGLSVPPPSSLYHPGASKKMEIPNKRVGAIIGKGGETIKYLQTQSGAHIQVTRDIDADPNSDTRAVELSGTQDQIDNAEKLIHDILLEIDSNGSGIGKASRADQFVLMVPNNKVGLVIGKGGEAIKSMQARSGARIQVIPLFLPPGDMSKERTVQIDGTKEQIEVAKQLVEEVISENRIRNQPMDGGYNSQQGYQAPPPTDWTQHGPPMQQLGYAYTQPGAYPGPPQYHMSRPNYPGYPPMSGGHAAGWDPSAASQNPQIVQGGSNHGYYGQQPPPQQQQTYGGPADGSGYNYTQAHAYNSQDGYSSYHMGTAQSGYAQPITNPSAGDDKQNQGGYNITYGNNIVSYETQADTNRPPAQPSPNQNYPHPGSAEPPSQGVYGAQPPSGYGSYGDPQTPKLSTGYAPSGYPHSLPPVLAKIGYEQTDAGAQNPPTPGYPQFQARYGAPPPAGQPVYGQPQQHQPYGGSCSQQPPPAYSTYATAGAQPAQPATGSSKFSPPS